MHVGRWKSSVRAKARSPGSPTFGYRSHNWIAHPPQEAQRRRPISHAAMLEGHVSVHTIVFGEQKHRMGLSIRTIGIKRAEANSRTSFCTAFFERKAITGHPRDVKYLLNPAKTSNKAKKSIKNTFQNLIAGKYANSTKNQFLEVSFWINAQNIDKPL